MMEMKYGILSEIDYTKGEARVYIDELDIVTDWATLPKKINSNKIFKLKQQVSVLIHDNGEDCEILNEVPSDDDRPPIWANDHTEGIQFSDGTTIIYDNKKKELTINAPSVELIFNCSKLTVTGDVVAGTDKISLVNHVHTTPIGPSGVPVANT